MKYGILSGVVVTGVRLFATVLYWGYTVILESDAGNHSRHMADAMRFAFSLFVLREAIFFFGIFWAFFDSALSPTLEIGGVWPPVGIVPINPFGIPLFNTVVLLRRGVTLTWSHYSLLRKEDAKPGLVLTVLLSFLFEGAQYVEYREATFRIRDGIFGRCFYFGTGFHGLHVIFGHIFLLFNLYRVHQCHFTRRRHISFECAVVYWHFVDVVWLFLYVSFYWWTY